MNAVLFWENYAKLYFDARKRIEQGSAEGVAVSKEKRHCFDPTRERLAFASFFLFLS